MCRRRLLLTHSSQLCTSLPTLPSVMSHGELETGHSGRTNTAETGECYKPGLCLPRELLVQRLPAQHSTRGCELKPPDIRPGTSHPSTVALCSHLLASVSSTVLFCFEAGSQRTPLRAPFQVKYPQSIRPFLIGYDLRVSPHLGWLQPKWPPCNQSPFQMETPTSGCGHHPQLWPGQHELVSTQHTCKGQRILEGGSSHARQTFPMSSPW